MNYIMKCCQSGSGGLRDKPGKSPDYYHTCYCLSGLSLCQYRYHIQNQEWSYSSLISFKTKDFELVKPTHPVHNIGFDHVKNIKERFSQESKSFLMEGSAVLVQEILFDVQELE